MPDKKIEKVKKINAVPLNKGWQTTSYGWKPSQADIDLRNQAIPQVRQKIEYLNSDMYKERLNKFNNGNMADLIKQRISELKNIQFFRGAEGSSMTSPNNYLDKGAGVQMAKGSEATALAHELGHVTSGTGRHEFAKSAGEGQSDAMSPAEAWYFINRDKNIKKEDKAKILKWYSSEARDWGNYMTDPSEYVLRGYDPHDVGAGEAKGDLDAVRFLLQKNGLTQKYGENITLETIKKAMKNPKVSGDRFFQRLLKRFGEQNIVDLNNNIAKVGNEDDQDMA
jgi:hypothetical protein